MTGLQKTGWFFVAVSVVVLGISNPSPRTAGIVLVPQSIPIFGIPFCIGFLVLQAFAAWKLKSIKAAVLMLFAIGAGLAIAGWGWSMDFWIGFERYDITLARHLFIGASCVSGLALGSGLAMGKLQREAR